MVQTVHLEQAFPPRCIINYNDHPTLPRPWPQPISVINMDFTGREITNTEQYVTLGLPINHGEFNELLEHHIHEGIIPTTNIESRNPMDDDLWLMLHNWPLVDKSILCSNFIDLAELWYPNVWGSDSNIHSSLQPSPQWSTVVFWTLEKLCLGICGTQICQLPIECTLTSHSHAGIIAFA